MDGCTKCGSCQAHCPVAAATDAFPGPKYAGPQAQRFRVIGIADESTASLCSGCGICTSVCPNDVAITDIIALAKAGTAERRSGIGLGQRLLNRPATVGRSEERRAGKECVSTCKSRGPPNHKKKKK